MTGRDNYMLCCSCGYAVKEKNIFKKVYKNTAICLCRKCAKELVASIKDWSDKHGEKGIFGGESCGIMDCGAAGM